MDVVVVLILVGYALVTVGSLAIIVHAKLSLPESSFFMHIRYSFVFCALLAPIGIMRTTFVVNEFPNTLIIASRTAYNVLFVIGELVYGLALLEYLKSIAPYDQRMSLRLVSIVRISIIINAVVGLVSSFFRYFPPQISSLFQMLLVLGATVIAIIDLVINAYLLHFVYAKIKSGMMGLKLVFLLCWILCIVLLAVSVTYSFSTDPILQCIPGLTNLLYVFVSYGCLMAIRVMLAIKSNRQSKKKPIANKMPNAGSDINKRPFASPSIKKSKPERSILEEGPTSIKSNLMSVGERIDGIIAPVQSMNQT